MTCLTDTFCIDSGLFDLVLTAATTIDYVGTVFFGSRWDAVAPDVVAKAEMIQTAITDFFARPIGGCQRFARLGAFHG